MSSRYVGMQKKAGWHYATDGRKNDPYRLKIFQLVEERKRKRKFHFKNTLN